MQIRDVVSHWCDVQNEKITQADLKHLRFMAIVIVTVLVLGSLAFIGIDGQDYSTSRDPIGEARTLKACVSVVGLMCVLGPGILMWARAESILFWDTLNEQWEISDDLVGLLAADNALPDAYKERIAQRLRRGGKITIGYLWQLEAELVREDKLKGEGHQRILRFASGGSQ